MVLRRARMGWSIDEQALAQALDTLLADPYASRILRFERVRVHPAVNANDLHQQHRTVVTVDRAHFKLRYSGTSSSTRATASRSGMPEYPTPDRPLLDHRQGREPGLDRTRPAVGGRLPQRGRRGRRRRRTR